jgi:hypothetical protein
MTALRMAWSNATDAEGVDWKHWYWWGRWTATELAEPDSQLFTPIKVHE